MNQDSKHTDKLIYFTTNQIVGSSEEEFKFGALILGLLAQKKIKFLLILVKDSSYVVEAFNTIGRRVAEYENLTIGFDQLIEIMDRLTDFQSITYKCVNEQQSNKVYKIT